MSTVLSALFDADAAAASDLAVQHRARATVADADAGYRADLVTEYVAARGDWERELALLAEAARYDLAHPGDGVRLTDELHGTQIGAVAS
jgi:hypothetical protein